MKKVLVVVAAVVIVLAAVAGSGAQARGAGSGALWFGSPASAITTPDYQIISPCLGPTWVLTHTVRSGDIGRLPYLHVAADFRFLELGPDCRPTNPGPSGISYDVAWKGLALPTDRFSRLRLLVRGSRPDTLITTYDTAGQKLATVYIAAGCGDIVSSNMTQVQPYLWPAGAVIGEIDFTFQFGGDAGTVDVEGLKVWGNMEVQK